MKLLAIVRPHLRGNRTRGVLALALIISQTALNLLIPWPLKIIFDSVLGAQRLAEPVRMILDHLTGGASENKASLLLVMLVVMLAAALGRAITAYGSATLLAKVGLRVVYQLRRETFDHLQRLSLGYYRRNRVGDLTARLTTDIQAIGDIASSGLNDLITNGLSVAGIIVVIATVDWRMALLVAGSAPVLLLVAGAYRTRIHRASRQLRVAEGDISAAAQEKLNAIQVIQAFGSEDVESRFFAGLARRSLDLSLVQARLQSELTPIVDLVGTVGLIGVIGLGGWEVLRGHLTTGLLFVFITYFRSTLSPVRQLTKFSSSLSRAEASAERISDVLELVPEVRDHVGARRAPPFQGAVTLSGVTYGYGPGVPVLRDLSLTVQPGSMVALVGPTGSGKTTLLGLIACFQEPQAGEVRIDGVDLRRYTVASVREQISVVLQEPVLFAGTIRENIAYGRAGASAEEVEKAAWAVGLHDAVTRLPLGYDTLVGERGGTLSGGQRQLVAIARAMVRDTPIVLLDEPTTGLDAEAETLVMLGLDRLVVGRTTFVCTHQLHTIERADLILVLQHGQIRELGTHRELVRARGLYAHWHDVRQTDRGGEIPPNERRRPASPLTRPSSIVSE